MLDDILTLLDENKRRRNDQVCREFGRTTFSYGMQGTHGLVSRVYRDPGPIQGMTDQIPRPVTYNVLVDGILSHCFPDFGSGVAKGVREFRMQTCTTVAFALRDRVSDKGIRAFLRGVSSLVS